MRGLWTAGIIDVMMENGVAPDALIGVSAGAAFGCNYKSRQPGRAIRYNVRFAKDPRYSGVRSLLTTGDYFNAEFGYHTIPKEYDVFDDTPCLMTLPTSHSHIVILTITRQVRLLFMKMRITGRAVYLIHGLLCISRMSLSRR